MSARDRERALEWFDKADVDMTSARLLAVIQGPAETICFLAQQGSEKRLKGYLEWNGVPFRRVHDLLELLNGCRHVDSSFAALEEDCRTLNPYSVQVRYPGFPVGCTADDARDALARAERIGAFVRDRLLPAREP